MLQSDKNEVLRLIERLDDDRDKRFITQILIMIKTHSGQYFLKEGFQKSEFIRENQSSSEFVRENQNKSEFVRENQSYADKRIRE